MSKQLVVGMYKDQSIFGTIKLESSNVIAAEALVDVLRVKFPKSSWEFELYEEHIELKSIY